MFSFLFVLVFWPSFHHHSYTFVKCFSAGWDFTSGASCLRISSDGRYIVYRVDAQHRLAQTYTCISKPPYFSALAFFPHASYTGALVEFRNNGELLVLSERWNSTRKGFETIQERITAGCPFTIIRDGSPEIPPVDWEIDSYNNRRVWSEVNKLFAQEDGSDSPVLLKEFTREPFVAIEPPDWAKEW